MEKNMEVTYTLSTGEKHRRYEHDGEAERASIAEIGENIYRLNNLVIDANEEDDEPAVYINPAHLVSIEVRTLNYG